MRRNADAMLGNVDRYLDWNLSVFPIDTGKRILDLGCGPGMYFERIVQYRPDFYRGVDANTDYIQSLRITLANSETAADALVANLYDPEVVIRVADRKFDYVLCFDVLEHLRNDTAALENIRRIALKAEAEFIFIRVPALQKIYGANDRAIGHFRRYHRESLRSLMVRCSLEVQAIRYQNFFGVLPWFFIGRVLGRTLAASAAESRGFDRAVPLLRSIENAIRPPVGLSLYCVCRPVPERAG